ncbi:hypothetical protein O181_012850 [Austropuccinia psidii MF-1]|uniref:Uncharacterized protein n=1 Tax=Austropuccinia psidii MF-1 TaxID=1389203 RepID=A0A9Q3BXW3_9BASI|nr:hypothetical protein [Austropuccinia psidii MF-1]
MEDYPFGREFPALEAPTCDGTLGSRQADISRWSNVGEPIPTGERPIHSSSEFPISRINIQGSDEPDGEDVEVVPNSIDHQSSASPSQPSSRRFYSKVILSNPRNIQPVLSIIPSSTPPPSPNPSLVTPVRPSPIPHPRNSPMVTF